MSRGERKADELVRERDALRERVSRLERELAELREARSLVLDPDVAENYRALLDRSLLCIYLHDMGGRFLDANQAALNLLGYERHEIPSLNLASLLDPAHLSRTLEAFEKLNREGHQNQPFEYRLRRRDGTHVWVEAETCLLHRHGKPDRALGIAREISDRKRAEQALRVSEEKYRVLVENANDAVFLLQDDRMKFFNRRASEVSGYSPEELEGIPFMEHVHPEDREMVFERHLRRLRGETFATTYPFRVVSKTGETLWVEINAVFISWEGAPAVLCVIRDITEVKRLEDELQQARRMEAVGRLAGGIAHDFNNKMTVVSGYSELLLRRFPPDDPTHQQLLEIKKAGDHAAQLTRQILAFSRKQMLQPRVINLNKVVRDMDALLRRLIGEDVSLDLALEPALGYVKADPAQMEQVVANLVLNARDAMPAGGRLTIETTNRTAAERDAQDDSGIPTGACVVLSVRDTGVGMDRNTLSMAFEPFFTTKGMGGTGLGLATVYGIVKQSGGHIAAESSPGRGSCFRIWLPCADEPPAHDEALESAHSQGRRTEVVLVVEDEDPVREFVRGVLAQKGYRVLEASRGDEALLLCERHQGEIHLVVTDVVMPGMGGRELCERLRAARPGIKVLFMSGYASPGGERGDGPLPEAAFLEKPFAVGVLLGKVREALSGRP